ncbi:hypothetical protein BYT27DRAFT_7196125 [Phlegmacium glaucopus]|nr:hypothetical protein BYT27DRAFT_7196125 [Phlegmacium glaucopus]
MSVPRFPPEILHLFLDEFGSDAEDPQSRAALLACTLVNRQFHYQANSYIFASLTISSQERLDALLDILNANPNIARHIRSFTVKHQPSSECPSAVFRQLCRLQEFRWMGRHTFSHTHAMLAEITLSVSSLCSDLPHLTALHFENMMDFPLSLFSSWCHLRSLTLIGVVFAKIQPETLSSSLFPSLRRLSISGPWSNDEAVGIIMTHAAPTLTTLILSDPPHDNARFFLNFKSTIVFPVLESIQGSFTMYLHGENLDPTFKFLNFLSQFLEHSTPMLAQIQIKLCSDDRYSLSHIQQPLSKGFFLPIDQVLSSPRYRALKTLDVVFIEVYSAPWQLWPDLLEVRMLLNEIFPAALSRSQVEIKITPPYPQMPYDACIQVHFVF